MTKEMLLEALALNDVARYLVGKMMIPAIVAEVIIAAKDKVGEGVEEGGCTTCGHGLDGVTINGRKHFLPNHWKGGHCERCEDCSRCVTHSVTLARQIMNAGFEGEEGFIGSHGKWTTFALAQKGVY